MKLASALLAIALLAPATAHAQDIAGKWTAQFPQRVRMTNGSAAAEDLGTASLTLEVKGDSVFGVWHTHNTNAPNPSTPRKLSGTFINGKLTLVGEPIEARVRRSFSGGADGEESPMKLVTFYEGALKDGAIEGTFYSSSSDETIKTPPVKWSAKR